MLKTEDTQIFVPSLVPNSILRRLRWSQNDVSSGVLTRSTIPRVSGNENGGYVDKGNMQEPIT